MEKVDYHGKVFRLCKNDGPGDVDLDTVFFYHQKERYLWGHYRGGKVEIGVLLGKVHPDSRLEFSYRHFDQKGQIKTGICHSKPVFKEGKLTLHEEWEWTGDQQGKGTSIIEEIKL